MVYGGKELNSRVRACWSYQRSGSWSSCAPTPGLRLSHREKPDESKLFTDRNRCLAKRQWQLLVIFGAIDGVILGEILPPQKYHFPLENAKVERLLAIAIYLFDSLTWKCYSVGESICVVGRPGPGPMNIHGSHKITACGMPASNFATCADLVGRIPWLNLPK